MLSDKVVPVLSVCLKHLIKPLTTKRQWTWSTASGALYVLQHAGVFLFCVLFVCSLPARVARKSRNDCQARSEVSRAVAGRRPRRWFWNSCYLRWLISVHQPCRREPRPCAHNEISAALTYSKRTACRSWAALSEHWEISAGWTGWYWQNTERNVRLLCISSDFSFSFLSSLSVHFLLFEEQQQPLPDHGAPLHHKQIPGGAGRHVHPCVQVPLPVQTATTAAEEGERSIGGWCASLIEQRPACSGAYFPQGGRFLVFT